MRWAVVVVNDQVAGTDGLTAMSRGLRSGRAIAVGVEHAHGVGVMCRLPEKYIALLIGREVAAQVVVGLIAFNSERETAGADVVWRAIVRGELSAVSARLARMTERDGIVVGAEITEVSLVARGACPTCKVVAVGEGARDHAAVAEGLTKWAAWRARHVTEVGP
jgi:hypothetical protein